jgi:hypothetical protein
MAQNHAASVQGVCIRVTRLAADGTPATGPNGSYAMDAFISATFTPDYEAGDEISEKSANGLLCVYYKANDLLKRVTLGLAICEPDPEVTEMLSGGTLLATTTGTATTVASAVAVGDNTIQMTANPGTGAFTIGTGVGQETVVITGVTGAATPWTAYLQFPATKVHASTDAVTPVPETVGYAAPPVGTDATPNGVAIEVWSHAVKNQRRAGILPYYHWVFPACQMTPTGDRVIENGVMANTFSGYGVGNAFFGDGPAGDWPFPSDRPYQYARVATAPAGINDYVAVS